MRFSVLISVYRNDNAEYLKVALESIYDKQNLKPNEIVIVFDGPLTEQLYSVVDNFCVDKDGIVKTVKLQTNCGLGEALKTGSKYCSYDYICRMDSDDISDSLRFEKQISFAKEHPEYDVIGTYISEFDEASDLNTRVRVVPLDHGGIVKMARKRNPMNHVTVCIKKSALMACGGYETLLLLEDYYLWLKMIVAGHIFVNIPEALVHVRIGKGFDSRRGSKTRIEGWRILQNYMLEHRLINFYERIMNLVYIRIFVYIPPNIRRYVYRKFLREENARGSSK